MAGDLSNANIREWSSDVVKIYSPGTSIILSDSSHDIMRFQGIILTSLLRKGLLRIKDVDCLICGCGIVQIPENSIKNFSFYSATNIVENNGVLFCAVCGSELRKERLKSIVTTPKLFDDQFVDHLKFPQVSLHKKIRSIINDDFRDRENIVSRKYISSRQNILVVEVDGVCYGIDPDFISSFIPFYMDIFTEKLIVIGGIRQLKKLVLASCLAGALSKNNGFNVCVYAHSRLKINEEDKNRLMIYAKKDWQKYAALFRMLSYYTLGCPRGQVVISSEEFAVLERMTFLIPRYVEKMNKYPITGISFDEFINFISISTIRSTLKKIRKMNLVQGTFEYIFWENILLPYSNWR
ncbi:MAG: hypothetical protein AB7D37_07655 [Desulfovibrio sp.]